MELNLNSVRIRWRWHEKGDSSLPSLWSEWLIQSRCDDMIWCKKEWRVSDPDLIWSFHVWSNSGLCKTVVVEFIQEEKLESQDLASCVMILLYFLRESKEKERGSTEFTFCSGQETKEELRDHDSGSDSTSGSFLFLSLSSLSPFASNDLNSQLWSFTFPCHESVSGRMKKRHDHLLLLLSSSPQQKYIYHTIDYIRNTRGTHNTFIEKPCMSWLTPDAESVMIIRSSLSLSLSLSLWYSTLTFLPELISISLSTWTPS